MGGCCSCCTPPSAKCTDYSNGKDGYFICDGNCGQTGTVWGSGPYTGDSCVCQAAKHAGVIGASGGLFRVAVAPGQDNYEGSTMNGITTSNYGNYGSSFTVSKF